MDERQAAGNAWNDFWGNLWGHANRPVNYQAPSSQAIGEASKMFNGGNMADDLYKRGLGPTGTTKQTNPMGLNRSDLGSASNVAHAPAPAGNFNLRSILNNQKLAGLGQQGIPPGIARPAEIDPDQQRIDELKALLNQDFHASGENDALINEAYSGALANIAKARGQANSNFEQSDARVADLTAGHVNEIQTKDRAAVEQNAQQLTGDYNKIYGDANAALSADATAQVNERGAMLDRLGIQEAGLGEAGQSQHEAITRNTQNQTGALQQADTYKAADLTRNTEQAQSQASAGVERRSALNSQLQKILGTIDGSEADVQNSMSMAKLQGRQQEKSDFMNQQKFNLDSLAQIEDNKRSDLKDNRDYALELQKLQQNQSGSGGVFDAVGNDLKNRGIDPSPYLQAYNEVMSTANFNPSLNGDKNSFYASKMKEAMKKKGLAADDSVIGRVVMGINNYGTDKLGN